MISADQVIFHINPASTFRFPGNMSPCFRGSSCKTYSILITQGRALSIILPWPNSGPCPTDWETLL